MNPQQTNLSAPATVTTILSGMIGADIAARQNAIRLLMQQDASALPALADAMASPDKPTAKAAKLAMERLVHHLLMPPSGKDRPDSAAQTQVADALASIAVSSRPRPVRACAVSLLGFAGARRQEKTLERLEKDSAVGEEARIARTRIKSVGY